MRGLLLGSAVGDAVGLPREGLSPRRALEESILLGGDTDTTASVTGALAGATLGSSRIPSEWIDGLMEWPRSTAWISALADRLAAAFWERRGPPPGPLPLFWPGLAPRNALFAAVVLAHGLRRALPPY